MPGLVLTVSTFTESRCVVSVAAASSFGTRGFAPAVRGVAAVCLVVVVSVVTLSCTAGTAGCCGCKRKWLATTHSVVSNDSMKRDSFRMNCVGREGDIIRGECQVRLTVQVVHCSAEGSNSGSNSFTQFQKMSTPSCPNFSRLLAVSSAERMRSGWLFE